MKRTKILFSLYILCCALISCDGSGNNLKEPTQMEFEQLKAEAIELATYLTDNYTVGDSIFFKTETGETEGFIVELNYFEELAEVFEAEGDDKEMGDDEDDKGEEIFSNNVVGYKMCTALKNENAHIQVKLFYMLENGKTYIEGTIVLNKNYDLDRSYTTRDGETIKIMVADKSCILQKLVGIVKVCGNQHSWELIQ